MPPKTTKPRTGTLPDKPRNQRSTPAKPRSGTSSAKTKQASSRKAYKPSNRKETRPSRLGTSRLTKYLAVIAIVFVFGGIFYYFFIRPYSYRWKPCYGQQGYGVCLPYGYKVHGLDISHYQGNINWHELRQNRLNKFPLHFIFMKATEGGDHTDSTFIRNFDKAYEHGFIRGAYHFFSPHTDPMKQADFYIRTVQLKPGDLPPVLDVEVRGKKKAEDLQTALKIWLKRVESHYGVKPIIYASYKFKMKYLNDSVFNSYPYWIAHYYVDSVRYEGKWDFWQHTDVGQVSGIPVDVDLNVYNGALEELQKMTIK